MRRRSHLGLLARSAEHDQGRITPPTESTHSTLSGSGRYVPAIFVIIVEQNETHLLWMTYTVQMKTHGPDETYFTFFAAGNEAGVVMQPLLKRHM